MNKIKSLLILTLLVSQSVVAGTSDFHVTESNQGIFFDITPRANNEVVVGNTIFQTNDWQKNPQYRLDRLMTLLTSKPLLNDKDHYVLVTRVQNIVPRPVIQVIDPNKFVNPEYHIRLNPSFKMTVINSNPLVFNTSRTAFGIDLTTTLTVGLITDSQIQKDANFNDLLAKYSVTGYPLHAVSVRYSSEFNHILDRMITITEFYDISGQSTLMNTYLAVSIKKNYITDGIGSGVFKSKIKSFLSDSAVESLDSLYKLLGIK